ncbi:hypothetical protein [Labilibaculum sp.]|uniref:hypothetical protein n=1 Tax=Labilibaculum sp. TaxID=2060723 RepID=UPI0035628196
MWFRTKNNFSSFIIKRITILSIFLLVMGEFAVTAQNNTSSPYSYFGLGELAESSSAVSSALGGGGLSYKSGGYLAIDNPASLAGIDSLKFIFNVGMVSKNSKLNQKGESDSFSDNNLTQLAFGFRVSPLISTAISLVPYTNVGYEITTIETVTGGTDYYQRTVTGNGGLNQLVWTNGFKVSENFHLGLNTIFIFGNNTHAEYLVLEESSYSYVSEEEMISQGVFVNMGAQYHGSLNREWDFSLGAKFQPKIGVSAKERIVVTNYASSTGDTIYENSLNRGSFDVPMTYALGVGLTKNKQLWVGADYLHEKWSDTEIFNEQNELEDRDKFSVGVSYSQNSGYETKFVKKLTYRFGAFYDTGYIKVNGENISTRAVTCGLGIPLSRDKGVINVAFEFGQMGTTVNDNVREDYGKITLEFSLFERWFMKQKYN